MDLLNKTAIVTGASKGIGHAVTEQLLQKGAKVAVWGLNKPSFENTNYHFFHTDVRNITSVEEAFHATCAHFGQDIDVLINNAGLGYFGKFEDISPEHFYELFEVNVYGIYHTCRFVIPLMKAAKKGHIINISSTAGLEGMAQVAAYCGTKHAVRGISDSLFRELRDFGIKVTAIYPRSVKTDFFRNAENIQPHDKMLQPREVAGEIIHVLETSDNFLVNELVFRPLSVK